MDKCVPHSRSSPQRGASEHCVTLLFAQTVTMADWYTLESTREIQQTEVHEKQSHILRNEPPAAQREYVVVTGPRAVILALFFAYYIMTLEKSHARS